MNELKDMILHINNAHKTLVWISYIDGLFQNKLVLSCYHSTLPKVMLTFIIQESIDCYDVACEKYLCGATLCRIESVVGAQSDVIHVVTTMLKMTFGGVA